MASDPPPVEDETVQGHEPSHDFAGEAEELSRPTTAVTMPLASDSPPQPAPLALVAAGRAATPTPAALTPSVSLTSAADALRDEEIERTRLFIVMGWVISVIAAGTVPFVEAPLANTVLFISGLVLGMMISFVLWR